MASEKASAAIVKMDRDWICIVPIYSGFMPSPIGRGLESPIQARQTQSAFHPLAQRNAFHRRDVIAPTESKYDSCRVSSQTRAVIRLSLDHDATATGEVCSLSHCQTSDLLKPSEFSPR